MSLPLFKRFYAKHVRYVRSLLRLLGVPNDERADVAQQVWIVVFRTLDAYDGRPTSARVWLGVIVRNAVRDWRRTRKRRPEFRTDPEEAEEEPLDAQTPVTIFEGHERRAELAAFLHEAIADDQRREAIRLHFIMGLTVREAAEATGSSFATAQWRLKLAVADIRRAVNAARPAIRLGAEPHAPW